MDKSKYFLDLSKCTDEEQKHIFSLLPEAKYSAQYFIVSDLTFLQMHTDGYWQTWKLPDEKTELTYPEFIKLFEGGEGETKLSIGWIDAQEEQPLCVSIGDWDGKQSDIVLAETFTGKKFLAQCYEGFMDGSAFFDWYQVDEVDSNEWLINESVSRWMKIPF